VRVAAIEALAKLDSHLQQETKPAKDNQAQRLPIEMIAEAVQGNLEPPLTKKVIPVVAVNHTDKKDADSESAQPTVENSSKEDQEFFDAAKEQISKSISAGEKPLPLSTLDSIVISSVEKQMECQQQEPLIESPIDPDADLDEFVALTEENAQIANWLLNKEVVDIDVEIQRLAARFLAQSSSDQAIPILLSVLDSDDNQLKREAILSLGSLLGAIDPQTEQSTQQIEQLHNVLIQELTAEDRDLRIAAATVLGDLGTSADSQVLLEALEDKEVAMRMQLLRSLINIAMRSNSKEINHFELAEEILKQLDNNNETGIHRAAVEGLVTLFKNKLNGSAIALKESAIKRLINAGLSGTDGQVKEMSWGLNALDKELSTTHLIRKMEQLSMSVERRYVIEMLGELHSA
jgi:HEAT repeat protein